jgi:hypothetical protein
MTIMMSMTTVDKTQMEVDMMILMRTMSHQARELIIKVIIVPLVIMNALIPVVKHSRIATVAVSIVHRCIILPIRNG